MPKVLVIIPAHNEEQSIYEVVAWSLKYADVSVTDDGSRDRTAEILRTLQKECREGKHTHSLHVITHERATHIPGGLQDGFKYGVGQGYEFCITMDAGLSHDPNALPSFINFDPSVDVVIGSRQEMENVPLYRKVISRCAALVVNYSLSKSFFDLRGPRLHDCTSGFRRYSRRASDIIALADLKSKAFDFHMEALSLALREGLTAAENPIKYVFSNSSFNSRVLRQAMRFGLHLIATKRSGTRRSH